MWPAGSVLNLVVFQDTRWQTEHLLSASHLRKTSNRLLSTLLNSIGYVWRPATAHAQTRSQISFGLWMGMGGLQENWVSRCILSVPFEVDLLYQLFFVQLCKNVDFHRSQHLLCHRPSSPPPTVPAHPGLGSPNRIKNTPPPHSLWFSHTSHVFRGISY